MVIELNIDEETRTAWNVYKTKQKELCGPMMIGFWDGYHAAVYKIYEKFQNGELTVAGLTAKEIIELKSDIANIIKNRNDIQTVADNRGKFIDWMLEKYPEIVKEYNGF